MKLTMSRRAIHLALAPLPLLGAALFAGCSKSVCAGSGCSNGTIDFGSNFKQKSGGGDISVVGKTNTFKLGQSVAMVAHLTENAGTKTLALEVSTSGSHRTVPYRLTSAKSDVLANLFTRPDLLTLGVSHAGKYTFRILHGSKGLAKGSFTEK